MKPLYVEVITRNLDPESDAQPDRRIVDYATHRGRVWLGKHSFWCMHNNHSVLTRPMDEPA